MTQFIAVRDFTCLGVHMHAGDTILVKNINHWECSAYGGRFWGNIVLNAKDNIILVEDSAEVKIRICMKVKAMYERQPYYKKITGQPEENITPTPWNWTDYITESRSRREETASFNFLTR